MISIRSAVFGGFVATVVVSCMQMMKNALGAFQDVHIPQTVSKILGMPDQILVGGAVFFLIGALVLSIFYAAIEKHLPVRSSIAKGLLYGFTIWLAMMLIMMPVAGAGIFALHRSAVVPAVDLVLTLIYGLLLAVIYAWDNPPPRKIKARA